MLLPRPVLHRLRIADAVLFWPVLLFVVWGEIAGPGDPIWFLHIDDKVLHFFAYFLLAGMAAAGFRSRRPVIAAVISLIVLGGVLEIVQGQVGRDMSAYDELANTLGAASGGILGRLLVEHLRKRFPAW